MSLFAASLRVISAVGVSAATGEGLSELFDRVRAGTPLCFACVSNSMFVLSLSCPPCHQSTNKPTYLSYGGTGTA